jgi:hypothetical protein
MELFTKSVDETGGTKRIKSILTLIAYGYYNNATNFDAANVLEWFNWTSRSCKNGISTCYV